MILASTSRWRAELLARLELDFESLAPDFDERAHDGRFAELGPRDFALLLARGKAESLVAKLGARAAWVLAADQIAVLDEGAGPVLLHKPGSAAKAVAQLMRLRGRSHSLVTAVVLARVAGGRVVGEPTWAIDEQRLTMRSFAEAEAADYVARHRPVDSVGAYHIEDAGIRLFERIEGEDYTGIIGLPLLAVCRLLRAQGLLP
nr:nucleoside triphosphate pyrophosphatase [Pseudenhygromyxa sp. WMMC2535]